MTEFFFHVVFSAFLFIPSLHLPSFNNYLPESTAGVFQYLRKTAIYKFCHEKGCPGRPGSMPCSPGKAQGSPGDCHKLGEWFLCLFPFAFLGWLSSLFSKKKKKKTKNNLLLAAKSVGLDKQKEIVSGGRTLLWWTVWSSRHNHFLVIFFPVLCSKFFIAWKPHLQRFYSC